MKRLSGAALLLALLCTQSADLPAAAPIALPQPQPPSQHLLQHVARRPAHMVRVLRDAAEFKLMINFHGANKPAGESRTWPNEITREGT
jgi:poly(3-hydroxybutyrate) depolymerase